MPREPRGEPTPAQVSLSPRGWAALAIAFVVIAVLLVLTVATLISQRQRTVLLNKQIASLLDETTLVLRRAGPALDALPRNSSTVASRARSAAELVAETRPLVAGLRASGLPQTLRTAGQVLQSIDGPGSLAQTLASLDLLASQTIDLENSAERAGFIPRTLSGLEDLATLVRLQRHTLAVQTATLENSRSTRELTAQALATSRRIMALAITLLDVARQTLAHTANLDHKVP